MNPQQYPEPAVGALIFNPEGELFLMRSHKWKDRYVVPGGHIELGESMEAALRREIREETSLEIFDITYLMFQEFIYDDHFWKQRHYIFFDYACKTHSTEVILNQEAQEYLWMKPAEALQRLDIDPFTCAAIQKYLKNAQPANLQP